MSLGDNVARDILKGRSYVKRNVLEVGVHLGSGGFGDVFLCYLRPDTPLPDMRSPACSRNSMGQKFATMPRFRRWVEAEPVAIKLIKYCKTKSLDAQCKYAAREVKFLETLIRILSP